MHYGWLALLLCLEVVSEALLQRWSVTQKRLFLFAGVALYIALALVFALAMKHAPLASFNAMWQCANVVILTLYGVMFLGEKLRPRQLVGVVAAVAAVALLQ